jgi:Fe-S-cluster containining protein
MSDLLSEEKKSELCLKCLYCCKSLYIPLPVNIDYIRFYRDVRGIQLKFFNFEPWLIVEHPCQHLTPKGCSIYKTRPNACSVFDGRKDMFYPEKCLWTQEERRMKNEVNKIDS